MTKKNSQTSIDRTKMAAELRHLADQIEEGVIHTDAGPVTIGDPLFLKTKRKVKEDRAYLTFACKISLTGATPPPAPVRGASKPASAKKGEQPREGMPAAAKVMKKEIARLWKEVGSRINAETRPTMADMTKLRRLIEEYRLYTPAAWAADWQACGVTVGRCLDAAAAGDLALARTLFTEINQQTKSCHKLHK